jgi:hypothetical protein
MNVFVADSHALADVFVSETPPCQTNSWLFFALQIAAGKPAGLRGVHTELNEICAIFR